MKIIDVKHIEDCFDGSFIKELLFDESISESFIKSIGKFGKLSYFKDFARPFYKIVFRDNFYIKGVEGNNTARVLLQAPSDMEYLNELIKKEVDK